eukprot:489621_1
MAESDLVLITGANGFIAGHIIKQLLSNGFQVRGTVRSLKDKEKYQYLYNFIKNDSCDLELVEGDLTSPDGWNDIVKGCKYVLHTAWPIIKPSEMNSNSYSIEYYVETGLKSLEYILNACTHAKIKRFTFTSSTAAAWPSFKTSKTAVINDKVFTDLDYGYGKIDGYARSKTMGEQYIRDFMQKNNNPFEYVILNPGVTIGPYLNNRESIAPQLVKMLLDGRMPYIGRVQLIWGDVRECAYAHISSMMKSKDIVNGKRYMIGAQNLWWNDIAIILKDKYGDKYGTHTNDGGYWLYYIISLFNPVMKYSFIEPWDAITLVDNQPSINDLGVPYRPVQETVIECAESMIQFEMIKPVPKTKKYVGKVLKLIVYTGAIVGIGWYARKWYNKKE